MEWVKRAMGRALADRKGVTALEYCMIAVGASTIVVTCYNVFFNRAGGFLNVVVFTG